MQITFHVDQGKKFFKISSKHRKANIRQMHQMLYQDVIIDIHFFLYQGLSYHGHQMCVVGLSN